jgi:4'-phosphopantetheinyl transferase
MLERSGVAVISCTAAVLAALPAAETALNENERRRADAFLRSADRDDFVAAHVLARACCAQLLNSSLDIAVVQECRSCRAPHGAPRVADRPELGVSWSHSGGVVAAAAVEGADVGIDVEPLARAAGAAEAMAIWSTRGERRTLHATAYPELAALLLWVRKEALLKLGRCDLDTLDSIDLASLPAHPPSFPRAVRYLDCTLLDVAAPELSALACVASPAAIRLLPLGDVVALPGASAQP